MLLYILESIACITLRAVDQVKGIVLGIDSEYWEILARELRDAAFLVRFHFDKRDGEVSGQALGAEIGQKGLNASLPWTVLHLREQLFQVDIHCGFPMRFGFSFEQYCNIIM